MKGTLYLVPNTLGGEATGDTIPAGVSEKIKEIRIFIAENIRNARRYLRILDRTIDIDGTRFLELNKHTPSEKIATYLDDTEQGKDVALLSEAGVPCVADPGAQIVRMAHQMGIRVIPLTGPSSILQALMASGLNGQEFAFLGYLPVKRPERIRRIREIEQISKHTGITQIFIETPYRNDSLLEDLIRVCHRDTQLCIAADITLEGEFIQTRTIAEWKKKIPKFHKRPVVYLLGS